MADAQNLTGRTSIQLSPEVKSLLQESARQNGRSASSEAHWRLRKSFGLPAIGTPVVTKKKEPTKPKKK